MTLPGVRLAFVEPLVRLHFVISMQHCKYSTATSVFLQVVATPGAP